MDRIHLNNAGASLMPRPVLQAMLDHLDLESRIGGYEAENREKARLEAVYEQIAGLIGAAPAEIAITENATVAWDMAFYSLPFKAGDRILTVQAEYGANFVACLQVAKRTGVLVEIIPNEKSGATDPEALEAMLDERVKLIAVTWIPTNGGLINPAAEIGRIAKRYNIPYLLDACQAAGQLPIDVTQLGCDMLSATGRKFLRGPRGTGFLFVRRSLLEKLEPPMIDHFAAPWVAPDAYRLRPDGRRFETWENNCAARLGLGAAVQYALDIGLEPIQERSFYLADLIRDNLRALPGVTMFDLGQRPGAIVSMAIDGVDGALVREKLAQKKINVCLSPPSSTLLDSERRRLPPLVRLSPHYYNSEEEIERACEEVARIAWAGA